MSGQLHGTIARQRTTRTGRDHAHRVARVMNLARSAMTPEALAGCGPEPDLGLVLRHWTAKEAARKECGLGVLLDFPLTAVVGDDGSERSSPHIWACHGTFLGRTSPPVIRGDCDGRSGHCRDPEGRGTTRLNGCPTWWNCWRPRRSVHRVRVAVLGGTRFIGRAVTLSLRDAGHEVAVAHRGLTPFDEAPDIVHLHGERRSLAEPLRAWAPDAVVDTYAMSGDDAGGCARCDPTRPPARRDLERRRVPRPLVAPPG